VIRSQPVNQKIRGMTEKYVLREAVRDVITGTVYRRQKHPFLSPPATPSPDETFHTYVQEKNKTVEEGRYRHRFDVPAAWKDRRVFLIFEGSMNDTEIAVNGRPAGPVHRGGFYEFRREITPLVRAGRSNLLEVAVREPSSNASVNRAERVGDFWVLGGIYRPVRLGGMGFDVWANTNNDTVTGESWEYPEFRGFFGDLCWAVIGMRTQPIGTKFHAASAYGPEGQLNLVNGQTGTYTPTLHFTFGPATRK
jgi:hypothetical protein